MSETHVDLKGMGETWQQQAVEYTADPDKGHAAGYEPQHLYETVPREVGSAPRHMAIRSNYSAWLRAIVSRDCPPHVHAVIGDAMGEGALSAFFKLEANGREWIA